MLKAIIVDDESGARAILQNFLETYCQDVEVVALCASVPEAVIAINSHEPDLVFLDIEMPEFNGFELIKFFKEITFDIVFVTAYSEYALRAFEISALDYLLKPVEIEALQAAVEKAKARKEKDQLLKQLHLLNDVMRGEEFKRIAVPMSDGTLFIEVDDIVMFHADGAYTQIHLKDKKTILVSKPLRVFDDLLQQRPQFFRSHRSFLINLNFIEKYAKGEGDIFLLGNRQAMLARDRKSEFESVLKENKLMW